MAAGDKCATDCTNLGKPSASAPKPAAPVPDKKDDKKPSGQDDKLAAPTPRTKPDVAICSSGLAIVKPQEPQRQRWQAEAEIDFQGQGEDILPFPLQQGQM